MSSCKHCKKCKHGCDFCACCGKCQRCDNVRPSAPTVGPPVIVPYIPYYPPAIQPTWPPPLGPDVWWATCETNIGGTIVQRNYDNGCAPMWQPGVIGTFETTGYVHTDSGSH